MLLTTAACCSNASSHIRSGEVLLEFPAGKLDPNGETKLTCAKRELQGRNRLHRPRMGFFLPDAHLYPVTRYSTEFVDLYLARGLTAGERKLDDGEFLETFIGGRQPQLVGLGERAGEYQ